ncbi:hypothetical protein CKALI_11110 [Corynebacterium kalinowskii]|uniref:Uncharacterized protein n=1 Tax=Corynebacterium kalinowskii TaxID=2675216 RepID=A0A6B8W7J7_9CORY|nr:hypothetical protein [Corynebacterium kalinowskii]QGU03068.1 hypothetical protein CKALI_11110 [Corynebacterium kalinowskii]
MNSFRFLRRRFESDGEVIFKTGAKSVIYLLVAAAVVALSVLASVVHVHALSTGEYEAPDAWAATIWVALLLLVSVFIAHGIVRAMQPSMRRNLQLRVSGAGIEMSGLRIPWSSIDSFETHYEGSRGVVKWVNVKLHSDVGDDGTLAGRTIAESVNRQRSVLLTTATLNVRHRALRNFLRWAQEESAHGGAGATVDFAPSNREFLQTFEHPMKSLQRRYLSAGTVVIKPGVKAVVYLLVGICYAVLFVGAAIARAKGIQDGDYDDTERLVQWFWVLLSLVCASAITLALVIVVRKRAGSKGQLWVSRKGIEFHGLVVPWAAIDYFDSDSSTNRSGTFIIVALRSDIGHDGTKSGFKNASAANELRKFWINTPILNVRNFTLWCFLRWVQEQTASGTQQ